MPQPNQPASKNTPPRPAQPSPGPAQAQSGNGVLLLVSENVLANLLPLMALRPTRVMQLRAAEDPKAMQAATRLQQTVHAVAQLPAFRGWQPKFSELTLPGSSPAIGQTRDLVASTLATQPGTVVGFSGGTRYMAIGAYQAALALGRGSFACEVDGLRFIDGHTGRLESRPDLAAAMKHFNVRLHMAVEGRNLDDWRHETPTEALRTFGLKTFQLRAQNSPALEAFVKGLRTHLSNGQDRLPNEPDALREALAKPLPPALLTSEPVKQFITAAVAAGILRADGPSFKLTAAAERSAVERSLRLLAHGWLDLAVYDRMLVNPRYTDVHWNMEPTSQPGSGGDIVCVDSSQRVLRVITCHASLSRSPRDHAEQLAERTARIGGSNARGMMVVHRPAQGQEAVLRSEAKRLGLDLALEADEIVAAFAPQAAKA